MRKAEEVFDRINKIYRMGGRQGIFDEINGIFPNLRNEENLHGEAARTRRKN